MPMTTKLTGNGSDTSAPALKPTLFEKYSPWDTHRLDGLLQMIEVLAERVTALEAEKDLRNSESMLLVEGMTTVMRVNNQLARRVAKLEAKPAEG